MKSTYRRSWGRVVLVASCLIGRSGTVPRSVDDHRQNALVPDHDCRTVGRLCHGPAQCRHREYLNTAARRSEAVPVDDMGLLAPQHTISRALDYVLEAAAFSTGGSGRHGPAEFRLAPSCPPPFFMFKPALRHVCFNDFFDA